MLKFIVPSCKSFLLSLSLFLLIPFAFNTNRHGRWVVERQKMSKMPADGFNVILFRVVFKENVINFLETYQQVACSFTQKHIHTHIQSMRCDEICCFRIFLIEDWMWRNWANLFLCVFTGNWNSWNFLML